MNPILVFKDLFCSFRLECNLCLVVWVAGLICMPVMFFSINHMKESK